MSRTASLFVLGVVLGMVRAELSLQTEGFRWCICATTREAGMANWKLTSTWWTMIWTSSWNGKATRLHCSLQLLLVLHGVDLAWAPRQTCNFGLIVLVAAWNRSGGRMCVYSCVVRCSSASDTRQYRKEGNRTKSVGKSPSSSNLQPGQPAFVSLPSDGKPGQSGDHLLFRALQEMNTKPDERWTATIKALRLFCTCKRTVQLFNYKRNAAGVGWLKSWHL